MTDYQISLDGLRGLLELGEDTREVLLSSEFDEQEIEDLILAKAID